MVFLEQWYEVILIAHLLLTFSLAGASMHHFLRILDYIRGKFGREKVEKRFQTWTFWSYLLVYVSGALIYPAFGAYIRAPFFDEKLPWATGLFEVKEHWGAIAMAMLAAMYVFRRSFLPSSEREKLWLYIPVTVLINIIIWYKIIVGALLSILKGSW